jgi:hypothetical protein
VHAIFALQRLPTHCNFAFEDDACTSLREESKTIDASGNTRPHSAMSEKHDAAV